EEEFEALPEPDLFYYELEDGNLRLINDMTTEWHSVMIHTLVNHFQRIGKYAFSERQIRLQPGRIVRCDVGVLVVAPDLNAEVSTRDATEYSVVIEVVSPRYRKQDWDRKMREYATAHVPRYWIVDKHPADPANGIVHQFVNRGGVFEPEQEIELSKLVAA
ncbi:MAG: Uma2 family endonuclease, partial [Natronosporangium sp.]